MHYSLFKIFESILFVIALSTDAFIASIAYGSNKIKIPISSVQVISLICTTMLGISLLLGVFLKPFLPSELLKVISFIILFLLGIFKLMDNIIKSTIEKYNVFRKEIKFSFLNLNFILNVYANPKEADLDDSKVLSPRESLSIAVALSIDNMAAGVGAALGNINIIAAILSAFIFSNLSVRFGSYLGNKLSEKVPFNLSWLSGILLITLAFLRLL